MLTKPIALQTFTVRDDIARDFKGTIEQIAKIGYDGIELGGDTGGMAPAEFRKFLDGLGLKCMSWHAPIESLSGDTQAVIDFAKTLGMEFVGCPYFAGQRAGDYYEAAKTLEKVGAKLKDAGIKLVYHNHVHEFTKFDGHYAIDIILANSKHDCVGWELDTYWVKIGGEEPQDFIRKYAGRVPLLHLKDRTAGPNPTFAEVGAGTLNWTDIFSAADEAGTEWYIVEQDTCQRPPLESARISLDNLKKMGVAR